MNTNETNNTNDMNGKTISIIRMAFQISIIGTHLCISISLVLK